MIAAHGPGFGDCESGANAMAGVSPRRLLYWVSGITPTISYTLAG
jgi:hypothetical protein